MKTGSVAVHGGILRFEVAANVTEKDCSAYLANLNQGLSSLHSLRLSV
jgi:hypothetical protein